MRGSHRRGRVQRSRRPHARRARPSSSIGPSPTMPSPRSTSVRGRKIGRKAGTVAGPSRGTSGSIAARTSSIGVPAMAVIRLPTRRLVRRGGGRDRSRPRRTRSTVSGSAGPWLPFSGSANWWPSRPSRLRRRSDAHELDDRLLRRVARGARSRRRRGRPRSPRARSRATRSGASDRARPAAPRGRARPDRARRSPPAQKARVARADRSVRSVAVGAGLAQPATTRARSNANRGARRILIRE